MQRLDQFGDLFFSHHFLHRLQHFFEVTNSHNAAWIADISERSDAADQDLPVRR